MFAFVCDWCGRPKQPREAWILGFAAEIIGRVTCRREMSFAPSWSSEWAGHPLAVHFCSKAHKDSYVRRFLNSPAAPVLRKLANGVAANATSLAAPTKNQVFLERGKRRAAGQAKRDGRPSRKVSNKRRFSKSDSFRAHGFGISLE